MLNFEIHVRWFCCKVVLDGGFFVVFDLIYLTYLHLIQNIKYCVFRNINRVPPK